MDIIDEFIMQVCKCPDNFAVIEGEKRTTYFQLKQLASHYAFFFTKNSTAPKVLIYLNQGTDAYAAIIGSLMAGGYYCPLNKNLPKIKKQKIIAQFNPDIFIYDIDDDEISKIKEQYITLTPDSIPETCEDLPLLRHELAYVIFTSGSTGEPKGVMIKRKAVSNFVEEFVEITQVNKFDRWGQFSSIGFDLSVVDLFTCICGGATLFPIVDKTERLLPAIAIQKYSLTIWHSVPSVIDLMAKAGHISQEYLESLRLMSFCGEPLYPRQLDLLFDANTKTKIFNTYGPTEATLFCTYQELTIESYKDFCFNTVSIGNPIKGWNLLLENNLDFGEIIIYGENIGVGYLNNETETKQKYKSLFLDDIEFKAFYTGDWACKKNGKLYFLGRKDGQVKINGNRVELNDIDSQIRQYGVINCYTVYYKNRLYTFIEGKQQINEKELRIFLIDRLPYYQIPFKFVTIPNIPRNINYKIDKNVLVKILEENENI